MQWWKPKLFFFACMLKYWFMYLSFTTIERTRKLMHHVLCVWMFTPHKIMWRIAIYKEWMPLFDLELPHELKIPIWCTLKILSMEFKALGTRFTTWVGKHLGKYFNNIKKWDPRFCLGMDAKHGGIFIIKIPIMDEGVEVLVDFEKYPVICHFHGNPQHLTRVYQAFKVWRSILESFNKSSRKRKVKLNKVLRKEKR